MTTLVMLHGWGASGNVWQPQAEYFKDQATVLTPTIPVWEAKWLMDYLEELPLAESVLLGWSLGGMLLLEALSELRDSAVGGFILVGVAPVFCRRPDYPWGQPPAVVRAMRRGVKDSPSQVLSEFARHCLAPEEASYEAQAKAAFDPPSAFGMLAAGLDYLIVRDLRPLLSRLSSGAVIIQGQEDRIVPPAQGQFLEEHLTGSRLNLLPGAGHLPFLTQAQVFNGILEQCLNKMS